MKLNVMGSYCMKKIENYSKCLEVLKGADKSKAQSDEIYRMGVIGQFNLTFELAWKALKEVMQIYGIDTAKTGSPREVLKEGYRIGFLSDSDIWLDMLSRRNIVTHIYNGSTLDEFIDQIFDNYIATFEKLHNDLNDKINNLECEKL